MILYSIFTLLGQTVPSEEQIAKETEKINNWSSQFADLPLDQVVEKLISSTVDFALKLLAAIVVFYIGRFIINRIHRSVLNIIQRRQMDKSLSTFILSALKAILFFILIIIVISILGIETSSFIALFASAGVAIGMALSGTLQNFAGGVLILLLKPYKVGDFIEAQGFMGTVKEIQIFNTVLNTTDNKSIYIPNGGLSTGSINNYSREAYRRIDWTIGISYGDDYDIAKQKILEIIASDDRIVKGSMLEDKRHRANMQKEEATEEQSLIEDNPTKVGALKRFFHRKRKEFKEKQASKTPTTIIQDIDCTPFIAIQSLASSSVDIVVRVWAPSEHYWGVYFDMNEKIYKELPKVGISFPFPQMDVHVQS